MKDDVFRWEYTVLADDGFDDGRTPTAVTFGHTGVAFPPVVHAARRPEVGLDGSGPWWFPQDLAVRGDLIGGVLRIARQFTLLPVVRASHLADDGDVEVVALRHVIVPTYSVQDQPPAGSEAAANVRATVRTLLLEADRSGEEALARCVNAVEELRRTYPGGREIQVRFALLRFSDREMIEGPPTRRVHPAIVIDGRTGEGRTSSEQAEVEAVQRVYDRGISSGRPDLALLAGIRLGELLKERGDIEARRVQQRTREAAQTVIAHDSDGTGRDPDLANAQERTSWDRSAEAAMRFGAHLHLQGDTDGARAAYQFAVDSGHSRWAPIAAFNLGGLLDGQGDSEAAESFYQAAIDSGDTEIAPISSAMLGLVLLKRGEVDRAEEAFNLTTPGTLLGLASMCAEKGDHERALQAYARAVKSGHEQVAPAAALALGTMLHEVGQLEGAEAAYRYAVTAKDPVVATKAALWLGLVRVLSKDPADAEQMFRRAITSPDPATVDMARQALHTLGVEP